MINLFDLYLTSDRFLNTNQKEKLQNLINQISTNLDYYKILYYCTSFFTTNNFQHFLEGINNIEDFPQTAEFLGPLILLLAKINTTGINLYDIIMQGYDQQITQFIQVQPTQDILRNKLLAYASDIKNSSFNGEQLRNYYYSPSYYIKPVSIKDNDDDNEMT